MSVNRGRLLAAPLLALAVVAGLAWGAGEMFARPRSSKTGEPGGIARAVTLRAADGTRLDATVWPAPPSRSAVLLLHGLNADRGQMTSRAMWLSGQGYAVLALDFRGHGQSEMRPRTIGWAEAQDARAGFDWLHARGHAKVGVIGVSMGGAAALLGPHGTLPADAFVLQAVYPTITQAVAGRIRAWAGGAAAALFTPLLTMQIPLRVGVPSASLSPIHALGSVKAPVLVIGGSEDRYTPPAETRALCHAAPACRGLWLLPDADHRETSKLDGAAYRARVGPFLRAALR